MIRALPSFSVPPANMFHSSSDVAPFGDLIRRVDKVTLTSCLLDQVQGPSSSSLCAAARLPRVPSVADAKVQGDGHFQDTTSSF